ncbi:hypothetical protein M2168_003579 [Streptomyces sp. CZ24]|nr:hypothetical protein [Streptomyces sp. CZ24]
MNAERSASSPAGGAASPSGRANSEVICDSFSGDCDCGTPWGGVKALRASSDCGLRSSASSVTCSASLLASCPDGLPRLPAVCP